MKTVAENEVVQMKKYQKEQEDIKHIKEFIASCGEPTYASAAAVIVADKLVMHACDCLLACSASCGEHSCRHRGNALRAMLAGCR